MSTPRRGLFRRRGADGGPLVVERVRSIELPILTEMKRRLVRGDVADALRYAYPLVLEDVEKAYGVGFPPEWTHEEILRLGIPPGAGPVGEFLPRLYRLYAPARYGPNPRLTDADGAEALELLRSIYAVAPMWRLYAWHRPTAMERLFPPRHPTHATVPDPSPGPDGAPAPEVR